MECAGAIQDIIDDGGIPSIIFKQTFYTAKDSMVSRKRPMALIKQKKIYLLSGLIFCGECRASMQGNRKKHVNKPMYISYRCGSRFQKRDCDNKEIRKEYVEEFVLAELEKILVLV